MRFLMFCGTGSLLYLGGTVTSEAVTAWLEGPRSAQGLRGKPSGTAYLEKFDNAQLERCLDGLCCKARSHNLPRYIRQCAARN